MQITRNCLLQACPFMSLSCMMQFTCLLFGAMLWYGLVNAMTMRVLMVSVIVHHYSGSGKFHVRNLFSR